MQAENPNNMKACRNCRQNNEDTARFCFQCGSRLAATLPVFSVPLPKQLQKSPPTIVAESTIAHPMQNEPVMTRENQGTLLSPELNQKIRQSLKKSVPVPSATAPATEKPRQVLNSTDKAVLKKILGRPETKSGSPIQIQRERPPFALQKLEKLAEEKQAQVERREREQQVQEDLAFLDQMFKKEQPRRQLTPTMTVPKEPAHEAISDADPKAEALARIENRRELARQAILGESNSKAPEIDATQWLNANKQRRPATPSEQLQRVSAEPGQEWMTPILTLAVFLYFCYVLYI